MNEKINFLLIFSFGSFIMAGIFLVIANVGADFQIFLGLALAILLIFLFFSKNSILIGFTAWIWLFVLGYRSIYLTSYWRVHPLSIFLIFLFIILLLSARYKREALPKLPKSIWIFSIFWIWGLIVGAFRGILWDRMIADALNFFMIIPLFSIIFYLSEESGFWKKVSLSFLGAGVVISLLGTLEYYFPQFRTLIPGFIAAEEGGALNIYGFNRASFSFFGSVTAILISALALPMINLVSLVKNRLTGMVIFLISTGIISAGIYISGTRVAWLLFIITSLLLAYFNFGMIGGVFGLATWGVLGAFFPQAVVDIFLSIFQPFSGESIIDSSLAKRVARQQDAFALALDNPLGVGWSGSGWVHGDFTQVAANLGLLAGVFFLGWYLFTLYKAFKLLRRKLDNKVLQTLFISFLLCGVILATEGVQVLTQLVMPVWFIWGLLEAYLRSKSGAKGGEIVST